MPTCKDCDWWKVIEGEKGRCRGRAPTATAVVMPEFNKITNKVVPRIVEVTIWPMVAGICEACGDFKNNGKINPEKS